MKIRQILTCILMSAVLISSTFLWNVNTIYAASTSLTANTSVTQSTAITVAEESIKGEVTEWRYQFKDGKLQKRLWSITYEKWLTDWMWV